MILLSDANVLIDLGYVRGLHLLARLAPTEVLDVVLQECEDERQLGLMGDVTASGVRVVAAELGWYASARRYRQGPLSTQDALNVFYAKTYGRVLLAGDKPLRACCEAEGIEVHSSLWLVEQAHAQSLVHPNELCRWLRLWPTLGRHLPPPELRHLIKLLGCADGYR